MTKRDTTIKDNSTVSEELDITYNCVNIRGCTDNMVDIGSNNVSGSFSTLKDLNIIEQDLKDCLKVIKYLKEEYIKW